MADGPNYELLFIKRVLRPEHNRSVIERYIAFFENEESESDTVKFYKEMLKESGKKSSGKKEDATTKEEEKPKTTAKKS